MMILATALAGLVHPDPDAAFIASIAADAELMEIAATDMDAAARMLIDLALDTLTAYVSIARDTVRTAA